MTVTYVKVTTWAELLGSALRDVEPATLVVVGQRRGYLGKPGDPYLYIAASLGMDTLPDEADRDTLFVCVDLANVRYVEEGTERYQGDPY